MSFTKNDSLEQASTGQGKVGKRKNGTDQQDEASGLKDQLRVLGVALERTHDGESVHIRH